MPQISMKLSKNIDIAKIDLKIIFQEIHACLSKIPNLDIGSCNSGVLQEDYSYIGLGDETVTKVYLEILWLENEERKTLKPELATNLKVILKNRLVPVIEAQGLKCVPRIRIADLGVLNREYYIGV